MLSQESLLPMTLRRKLTDTNVLDFKPKAKRYLVHDTDVPGLAMRVGKSRRTWVLIARFKDHTARRSLGIVGKITVDVARTRARRLHEQMSGGIDTHTTFGEVLNKLVATLPPKRYADELDRALSRDAASLLKRPIASITKREIIQLLEARRAKRGRLGKTESAAHHLFSYLRRVFGFAVSRDILEHSPCDRIRVQELIGTKSIRTRVLSDGELRKIWNATFELGDPYGSSLRLILLTGARRSEASGALVREVDIVNRTWTLAAERTKSSAQHVVYLAPTTLQLMSSAIAATESGYLWGHDLRGWSKTKRRLDTLAGVTGYTLHDMRRTFRTRLSGLGVAEHVAELAIAHARKGLMRVYDQHRYHDEMRVAFEHWHDELLRIVGAAKSEQGTAKPKGSELQTQRASH
jgi:integrase